jgi:hypothetical protein
MTQRGLPPIDPSDLRDHATPERVDRIWRRVAADISHAPATSYRERPRFWVPALAATLAAFAVGVVVGKGVGGGARDEVLAVSSPDVAPPRDPADIFVAGTQARQYALPGGGTIALAPGSIVEVLDRSDGVVRLRLVQGEAAVDTAGAPSSHLLDIVAEDTVLSTGAGSALRVSRTNDQLDVSVSNGQVDLRSPNGRQSLKSGDRAESVALRRRQPTVDLAVVRPRASSAKGFTAAVPNLEPPPAPAAAALPDWRARSAAGDFPEAYRLLRDQPGGVDGAIGAARSAAELMDVHDVVVGSDAAAAMRALTRIVEAFPNDELASIAAYKLGTAYKNSGQPDQARVYFERVAGPLAEDAMCQRLRLAGGRDEALRVANEYLGTYHDGRCSEQAQRIVAGESPPADDDTAPAPTPSAAADAGKR